MDDEDILGSARRQIVELFSTYVDANRQDITPRDPSFILSKRRDPLLVADLCARYQELESLAEVRQEIQRVVDLSKASQLPINFGDSVSQKNLPHNEDTWEVWTLLPAETELDRRVDIHEPNGKYY